MSTFTRATYAYWRSLVLAHPPALGVSLGRAVEALATDDIVVVDTTSRTVKRARVGEPEGAREQSRQTTEAAAEPVLKQP